MIAVCAACATGLFALGSAAGDPPGKPSTGAPAVFDAARARGDASHAGMEPSDPQHQNLPSFEEVVSHFRAKGWSESRLSSLPAAEIATAAAKIEQDVICACGCPRQSIYDCNCRTAAELRGRVLDELARLGSSAFDLATEDGRSGASRDIARALAGGAGPSGGQNTLLWLFVVAAVGLVAIVVVRRRGARSDPGGGDPPR